MENKLIIEKKLSEWAGRNDYPISGRHWKQDAILLEKMEQEMQQEMNPKDYTQNDIERATKRFLEGSNISNRDIENLVREGNDRFQFLGIPTLQRDIYTPSGVVQYMLNFLVDEEEIPINEKQSLDLLNKGERWAEDIHFCHGPNMQNWRSDRVTPTERSRNADIFAYVNVGHPEGKIYWADIKLIGPDGEGRIDSAIRAGNDRFNRANYALNNFFGYGGVHLPEFEDKGIYEPLEHHREVVGGETKIVTVPAIDLLLEKFNQLIKRNEFK